MSFTIYVRSLYEQIDVFYDYEGWDEDFDGWQDDEDVVNRRQFIQRCIDADPEDAEEMEELWETVTDIGINFANGINFVLNLINFGKVLTNIALRLLLAQCAHFAGTVVRTRQLAERRSFGTMARSCIHPKFSPK